MLSFLASSQTESDLTMVALNEKKIKAFSSHESIVLAENGMHGFSLQYWTRIIIIHEAFVVWRSMCHFLEILSPRPPLMRLMWGGILSRVKVILSGMHWKFFSKVIDFPLFSLWWILLFALGTHINVRNACYINLLHKKSRFGDIFTSELWASLNQASVKALMSNSPQVIDIQNGVEYRNANEII